VAKAEVMRVFVPAEDALSGNGIPLLVPYRCGLACAHELRGFDEWNLDAPSLECPPESDASTMKEA